jgi:hypothetical protein
MKIHPLRDELFRADGRPDGRTDRLTDMTKMIDAFRKSVHKCKSLCYALPAGPTRHTIFGAEHKS